MFTSVVKITSHLLKKNRNLLGNTNESNNERLNRYYVNERNTFDQIKIVL